MDSKVKESVKQALKLKTEGWKLFFFSCGGHDAEDGYVLAKDEKDIKSIIEDPKYNLMYGANYGINSYEIELVKLEKYFLKKVYYSTAKKEKEEELNKISHFDRDQRDAFFANKENVDQTYFADYILKNFKGEAVLLQEFSCGNKVHN